MNFIGVLSLFIFGLASSASAEVFLRPSIMQIMSTDESFGSKTTTSRTLVDGMFGYTADSGLTFGLLYGTEKQKIDYTTSTTEASRTSYGPSIGWASPKDAGLYFIASYFITSDYISSGITYKGTGYQADLGFRFPVNKSRMGFQLSYKQFEYTKYSAGGASYDVAFPMKHTYLDPYFTAFFSF